MGFLAKRAVAAAMALTAGAGAAIGSSSTAGGSSPDVPAPPVVALPVPGEVAPTEVGVAVPIGMGFNSATDATDSLSTVQGLTVAPAPAAPHECGGMM